MKIFSIVFLLLVPAGWVPHCGADIKEEFPEFFREPPAAPPGPNGWELMLKLPEIPDADAEILKKWQPGQEGWLKALDAGEAVRIAHANHKVLTALDEILNCAVIQPGPEPGKTLASRSLIRLARAFNLYLTGAGLQARKGKASHALGQCWKVAAFCRRYCDAKPILIDTLVAITFIRVSLRAAGEIAATCDLSPADVREAADECARYDTIGPAIQRTLVGEARWAFKEFGPLLKGGEEMRELIFKIAVEKEHGQQELARESSPNRDAVNLETAENIRSRWKQDMPATLKSALAEAGRTDWQTYFQDWAQDFRASLTADTSSVMEFRKTYLPVKQRISFKGGPLEAYFPESPDTGEFLMRTVGTTVADIRLVRVAILLRGYEKQHGKLPDSLGKLVPEFVEIVPRDPFDGKEIRYDRAARKMWCVGMNLIDDTGADEPDHPEGKDDLSFSLPFQK